MANWTALKLCPDWRAGQVCEASSVLISFLAAGAEVLGRAATDSWTCQNLGAIITFLFIGTNSGEDRGPEARINEVSP